MKRSAAPIAALVLSPAVARAAEGMPQLDFANPLTISQIVWGAFIFAALYYVLKQYALPEVEGVLAERAATIDGDLDAARSAKSDADAAAAEVNAATARARASAQGAINAAIEKSKSDAGARAAELNARLDAQLAEAEQRIGQQRQAALGGLRQVATETAELVVQRLVGQPADRGALDGAVGTAMAARGHA